MIGTRCLDRAFDRLGAGVGEEHRISKGVVDQLLRQLLALRTAVEVGNVHQRLRLLLDCGDQPFMRMAEQVDRDTAGEIEITRAVLVDQVAVLAANWPYAAPGIDGHERADGHVETSSNF